MADPKAFFGKFGQMAVKAVAGTPLFASVALAQAALETGYAISKPYNNMFGIKGTNSLGRVFSATTKEYLNGKMQTIQGTGKVYGSYNEAIKDGANKYTIFKAYDDESGSWKDYVKRITESKRYKPVLKAETPQDQIAAIKAAGYATDPNYVSKITAIISKYNLEQYDRQKKAEQKKNNGIKAVIIIVLITLIIFIVWQRKSILKRLQSL